MIGHESVNKGNNAWNRHLKRVYITTIVTVVALALIFDLSGFGGSARFYAKWIQCGSKPLASGATYETVVPHYIKTSALQPIRLSPKYFCTAYEAEKRGYSASPYSYDFPVLRTNNALCKKETDPPSETAAIFSECDK